MGLKNEFDSDMLNESSMFKSLKFYCILDYTVSNILKMNTKNLILWPWSLLKLQVIGNLR